MSLEGKGSFRQYHSMSGMNGDFLSKVFSIFTWQFSDLPNVIAMSLGSPDRFVAVFLRGVIGRWGSQGHPPTLETVLVIDFPLGKSGKRPWFVKSWSPNISLSPKESALPPSAQGCPKNTFTSHSFTYCQAVGKEWHLLTMGNGTPKRQRRSIGNSKVKASSCFPRWIWKAQNLQVLLTWENLLSVSKSHHILVWYCMLVLYVIQRTGNRVALSPRQRSLGFRITITRLQRVMISQLSLHMSTVPTNRDSWKWNLHVDGQVPTQTTAFTQFTCTKTS